MDKIINIPSAEYDTYDKYILQAIYNGFGFYRRENPRGYYDNGCYLIANDKIRIICESYNYMRKEDLISSVDNYLATRKFNLNVFTHGKGTYLIQPRGTRGAIRI